MPTQTRKQVIEEALGTIYAGPTGRTAGTMIEGLAEHLDRIWDGIAPRYDGDLVRGVHLNVWNWFAGGDTALTAAETVVAAVASHEAP